MTTTTKKTERVRLNENQRQRIMSLEVPDGKATVVEGAPEKCAKECAATIVPYEPSLYAEAMNMALSQIRQGWIASVSCLNPIVIECAQERCGGGIQTMRVQVFVVEMIGRKEKSDDDTTSKVNAVPPGFTSLPFHGPGHLPS